MKYLVSTKESQGERSNDFSFCDEGEPVFFGFECSRGHVDDHCGCHRSMCGAVTAKATTTMKVAEVGAADTINLIREHFKKNWKMEDGSAQRLAEENFLDIAMAVRDWEFGTVVERRADGLKFRPAPRHHKK